MKLFRTNLFKRSGRRFHGFCIGAAKTGTTTLAACFGSRYRAAHEPEVLATNALVIDFLEGRTAQHDLVARLRERDKRLDLELESAHPLAYLSGVLADTFPDAKFLITVREPQAWLRSRLQYHYTNNPPDWAAYRDYFWRRHHVGYPREESVLEQYGLYSLDTYLRQYADHYRRVLRDVPENRRLVIATAEIDGSLPRIAGFLDIPASKLAIKRKKRSKSAVQPIDAIDYVRSRIDWHCKELMECCLAR
jgi:Sulfotransferase domain